MRSVFAFLLSLGAVTAGAQQLPPPRDGDIRVLYWAFLDETEVVLTLQLRSAGGEELPISLQLGALFSGKRPAVPLTQVEVRAHPGLLWAPRPQLTIVLDGREVVFAPPGPSAIHTAASTGDGTMMIGMAGSISIATLKRMASARSVGGNALRLDFELGDTQREAVARFTERLLSEDPALLRGRQ